MLSDLDMRPLVPGAYDTVLQHRAGPLLVLLQHHTLQGGPQQVVIGQRKSLLKMEVRFIQKIFQYLKCINLWNNSGYKQ